jgi:metal-dependent amidase/aminoacylase/carboxypeptidase family protein
MKQKIISFLELIKDEVYSLSKFLYSHPEASFKEYDACNYILTLLKDHNFRLENKFCDIPTAFYAEYGSGYPRICYVCNYDASPLGAHTTGHNLVTAMSYAAAVSLSKVLNQVPGTIILLGCPGESLSGSIVTMAKQGVFKNIDVVLMAHPDIKTFQSGKSMAIIPLKFTYSNTSIPEFNNIQSWSPLNAVLHTLNCFNLISTNSSAKCFNIDRVHIDSTPDPYASPYSISCQFYIRSNKMQTCAEVEKVARQAFENTKSIMKLEGDICLHELPYDELLTNSNLSRLFSHNLKESGIINIDEPKDSISGLGIGIVSHLVPCIQPYISIVEDDSIKYSSMEFAKATISRFAMDQVMKASQALATTGLDLIQNDVLLTEAKSELYDNI